MATSSSLNESTNGASIPIFDLSTPSPDLATAIVSALEEHGFLFVKASPNLPISASDTSQTFIFSSQFFHAPASVKAQVPMQGDNRGWTAMHAEELDPSADNARKGDPKEAFNFGEFDGDSDNNGKRAGQPLPPIFATPEAEAHFARFQTGCRQLCLQLLALIAQGLGVGDTEWFATRHDPRHGPSGSILRLLYYPASTHEDTGSSSSLRAGAHSDYGSLTLLFRRSEDPGGLEIETSDGWSAVPVHPKGTEADAAPPVLVNVGDLLSYWTEGLLRSTVHRVSFAAVEGKTQTTNERYSVAYFCHPCRDTLLEPVPSVRVAAHVAKQQDGDVTNSGTAQADRAKKEERVMTATEHLQSRLRATYGWKEGEVSTA